MNCPGGGSLFLALLVPAVFAAPSPEADGDGSVSEWSVLALADSSEEMVIEEDRPDQPDPGTTSSALTVVAVDERLADTADVAQVVDSAAGTTVRRLGGLGDWSGVSIRGSTMRQVQVYLDGVPLNPDGMDSVNLSELPLGAFSRVEVYRGNAPPEFAAAPVGGVVNLVTGDERERSVSFAGGSHGTFRARAFGNSTWDGGKHGERDLVLFADAFRTKGDYTWFSDGGTPYNTTDDRLLDRNNNDKSQVSAHGRMRLGGPGRQITLVDAFLSRSEGLPGHANNPALQSGLQTTRNLSSVEGAITAAPVSLRLRAHHLYREEVFDDSEGEISLAPTHNRYRTHSFGLFGHGVWVPVSWITPALTVTARHDRLQAVDLLSDVADDARSRTSGHVAASAHLRAWGERITAVPVLQLTALSDQSTTDQETTTSVDPRLGLLIRPLPWLAAKSNVGHYLRPPDLLEVFGDRGFVRGNPDLEPESGWQWDVALRSSLPAEGRITGSVEAGAFWSDIRDLIVYEQNSQLTITPDNLGRAWVQGWEGSVDLRFFERLDSQTSITRTTTTNLVPDSAASGRQLPHVPEWEIWQATSVYWQEWIRVGHNWSFTDGNYLDSANYLRVPARSLHGAFVRLQPGRSAPSVELSVLNLTNRTANVVPRNPLDPDDDARIVTPLADFTGYPLPGRTWMATVRWDGW